jgi:hypothetical protein
MVAVWINMSIPDIGSKEHPLVFKDTDFLHCQDLSRSNGKKYVLLNHDVSV